MYAGNENCYICEGVVPLDVLQREADLRVPVAFLLQVQGIDDPPYELSQYSDISIFHTKPATQPIRNLAKDGFRFLYLLVLFHS